MKEQLLFAASARFEAARQLTSLPASHRCRQPHGHSFLARIRTALPKGWARFPGNELNQLRESLAAAVATLDYSDLNRRIDYPSDENLARWIKNRAGIDAMAHIGIQSTHNQGVDLSDDGHVQVWRRYVIESAHQLPNVPAGHKCGRMHGHSFTIILHAGQFANMADAMLGYDRLDRAWAPVMAELNFTCLNDVPGLENPTSENIASWIWRRLEPGMPELAWVTVYETASCSAHFNGAQYRIWKEMSFDSAVQFKRAPRDDARRRIHGHTYTTRLHLCAPLDEVMGWTVDYGDVKELFTPIFKQLDHQPLHEIVGTADTDTASLARFIRDQAAPVIPQLDRIDLYEGNGSGVILAWGAHAVSL